MGLSLKNLVPLSARRALGEWIAPYSYPQYVFGIAIRQRLPRPENRALRVLDVPCGRGETSWLLTKHKACTVDAMDIADWAILYAKKRFASPRITFIQGDLYKDLSGTHSAYDAVCIINSLFCLPDAAGAMDIARRLVRPDGKVFVPIPNHQSHDFVEFQKQDPVMNRTVLSREEAREFFRQHSFEVAEEVELGRTRFRRKFPWCVFGKLSHLYLLLADRVNQLLGHGSPGYFLFVLTPCPEQRPCPE